MQQSLERIIFSMDWTEIEEAKNFVMVGHWEIAELSVKLELVLAFPAKAEHNFWIKVKENPTEFLFYFAPSSSWKAAPS